MVTLMEWAGVPVPGSGDASTSPPKVRKRMLAPKPTKPRPKCDTSNLRRPTEDEMATVADLRNVGLGTIKLAVMRGWLSVGQAYGHQCWFIHDRDKLNVQARRIDGGKIGDLKAKSLPNARATVPIGIEQVTGFDLVALVEGGPDMLGVLQYVIAEGRTDDVTPVAFLGAGHRFCEIGLTALKGKHVRIFPHHGDANDAGGKAGRRWHQQLTAAGISADIFDLSGLTMTNGNPVGDVNDLTSIEYDSFEQLGEILP